MDNRYLLSYDFIQTPLELPDFYVYQIGRIICNEKTFYNNHYHSSYYELTVVNGGEGIIYTNNVPVTVKSGDIYLSCLHDIHAIKSSETDPLQYDFFSFYPKDPTLSGELIALSNTLISANNRLFHSNRITTLLPMAINEMKDIEKKFSSTLLNSILWQISVYVMRTLNKENASENISLTNKTLLCYGIMDYINANIYDITSLTELTEVFLYSYDYLSKVFKETTSMTLIEFYNMQRLEIAENLISEDNMTLDEIANKINFSTAFSLSKAFKKYYKISPSQYRRNIQKAKEQNK